MKYKVKEKYRDISFPYVFLNDEAIESKLSQWEIDNCFDKIKS